MGRHAVLACLAIAAVPISRGQLLQAQVPVAIEKLGRFGLLSATGDTLLPCQYAFVGRFDDGTARVNEGGTRLDNQRVRGGKWGLVSETGKWVLEPRYELLDEASDGLLRFRSAGLYGFVNARGKEVVPAQYVQAFPYRDGHAWVQTDAKSGEHWQAIGTKGQVLGTTTFNPVPGEQQGTLSLIKSYSFGKAVFGLVNVEGELLIKPDYEKLLLLGPNLLAYEAPAADSALRGQRRWGLMNERGVKLSKAIYETVGPLRDGRVRVERFGKSSFLDADGNLMILPEYACTDFSGGFAGFRDSLGWGLMDVLGQKTTLQRFEAVLPGTDVAWAAKKDGFWGAIRPGTGEWLLQPRFDTLRVQPPDLLLVGRRVDWAPPATNLRWGAFGTNGQERLPVRYTSLGVEGPVLRTEMGGRLLGYIDSLGQWVHKPAYDQAWAFREGLARVRAGDRLFFIRPDGSELPLPVVTALQDFSEGLAAAQVNGKWGYLNKQGKFIISPRYEACGPFVGGLAPVSSAGLWGFVDSAGRFAVQPRYEAAQAFSEGLAAVRLGGVWGYVDRSGRWAVAPRYTQVQPFSGGRAAVSTYGDYTGYIDRTGRKVLHEVFAPGISIPFSEGYVAVTKAQANNWLFADKSGIRQTLWGSFLAAGPFQDGLAPVLLAGNGFSLLNTEGKLAFEPIPVKASDPAVRAQLANLRFTHGLAPLCDGQLCGYVTRDGHWGIEPRFREAGHFSQGLAPVLPLEGMTNVRYFSLDGIELGTP